MATYWSGNTFTNSGTSGNITTTTTDTLYIRPGESKHVFPDIWKDDAKKVDTIKFKTKAVKTLPFEVSRGKTLLQSLQQEFDHWAGKQMDLLFSH